MDSAAPSPHSAHAATQVGSRRIHRFYGEVGCDAREIRSPNRTTRRPSAGFPPAWSAHSPGGNAPTGRMARSGGGEKATSVLVWWKRRYDVGIDQHPRVIERIVQPKDAIKRFMNSPVSLIAATSASWRTGRGGRGHGEQRQLACPWQDRAMVPFWCAAVTNSYGW